MGKKRRTEITIETDEVVLMRRRRGSLPAWCEGCGKQVNLLTPDGAAEAAGVTSRTIYRWVEADKVHFAETAEGLLLICLDSLTAVTDG